MTVLSNYFEPVQFLENASDMYDFSLSLSLYIYIYIYYGMLSKVVLFFNNCLEYVI